MSRRVESFIVDGALFAVVPGFERRRVVNLQAGNTAYTKGVDEVLGRETDNRSDDWEVVLARIGKVPCGS